MAETIRKLTIEGFKSIRKLELELGPLNILIGANGAGKSNLVSFFRLLRAMIDRQLQVEVRKADGGADSYLYMGPKITKSFDAALRFGRNGYEFSLIPTHDSRFIFLREDTIYFKGSDEHRTALGSSQSEAILPSVKDEKSKWTGWPGVASYVFESVSSWVVYHFHDTSSTAAVRRRGPINDDMALRPDAGNLAAFLYRLQNQFPTTTSYTRIRDVVRLAAPFFDDFILRPIPTSPDEIQLEWRQQGSDYPFRAHQLSDGTLRFICLATALLQPDRPVTVLFDEPELGLHPYALTLLGNLFRQATESTGKQIIVSTQSAPLIDEFRPEDVIVVERTNGESTFRRLDSASLSEWLDSYSLGELWKKNILGGRPREEGHPEPAGVNGRP